MAHGICEGMWLKWLLLVLKIAVDDPINMLCDNQAVISIAKNLVHHDQIKRVKIDKHFIKEKHLRWDCQYFLRTYCSIDCRHSEQGSTKDQV